MKKIPKLETITIDSQNNQICPLCCDKPHWDPWCWSLYLLYQVRKHPSPANNILRLSFRQHGGLWFHCNDHQILPASIDQVRKIISTRFFRGNSFRVIGLCISNLASHFRCLTVRVTFYFTTNRLSSTANRQKRKTWNVFLIRGGKSVIESILEHITSTVTLLLVSGRVHDIHLQRSNHVFEGSTSKWWQLLNPLREIKS